MGQLTEELLREMEHLKSELTGEFYVCMYAQIRAGTNSSFVYKMPRTYT